MASMGSFVQIPTPHPEVRGRKAKPQRVDWMGTNRREATCRSLNGAPTPFNPSRLHPQSADSVWRRPRMRVASRSRPNQTTICNNYDVKHAPANAAPTAQKTRHSPPQNHTRFAGNRDEQRGATDLPGAGSAVSDPLGNLQFFQSYYSISALTSSLANSLARVFAIAADNAFSVLKSAPASTVSAVRCTKRSALDSFDS